MSDSNQPATRGQLETLRQELRASEERLRGKARTSEERILHEIAAASAHTANVVEERVSREIAAAVNVVIEHNREMFRIASDQTRAVDEKVTALEGRVVDHVADDARHRVARRRR